VHNSPAKNGSNAIDPANCPMTNGVIGDRVWLDTDGDGAQDPGETTGVGNVTVKLIDPPSGTLSDDDRRTSGAQLGMYQFTGLAAGSYYVAMTPPGAAPARRDHAEPDGADNTGHRSTRRTCRRFGLQQCAPFTIGDRVWIDANGNGLQDGGSLVSSASLSNSSTQREPCRVHPTMANGIYSLTRRAAGPTRCTRCTDCYAATTPNPLSVTATTGRR